MKITCPGCGKVLVVSGLGRKKLGIALNNVCESLRHKKSISLAAAELGCSEGYIFNSLKAAGLKAKDLIK
jgi:hypothetical protein